MTKFEEIHIEITNHCNFNCYFCPISKISRPKMMMPFNVICQIIDEIKLSGLSSKIAFHLLGEPLLHPRLYDILSYCRTNSLKSRVVTNGYLLQLSTNQLKLDYADVVDISIRAKDANDLLKICNNDNYNEYIGGINNYIRNSNNDTKIRLRLFSHYAEEILIKLGLEYNAANFKCEIKKLGNKNIEIIIEKCLDWKGDNKKYPSNYFGYCNEFNTGFSILSNGDITTCCWDYDGKNTLGNFIVDGGLNNVLNNELATKFCNFFGKRRVPTKFCQQCLGRPNLLKSIAYQCKEFLKALC